MDQMEFDTGGLRKSGQAMHDVGDEVTNAFNDLQSSAGDPSALGGQDLVGGIASMIYDGVMGHLGDCIEKLEAVYRDHGDLLGTAADLYDQTESDNTELATSSGEGAS